MFLHARQIIRRRLKAAAEKARAAEQAAAAAVEKTAEELAADARKAAEVARADFIAAFDRFNATLHALEAHGQGGAAVVVEAIDRPVGAIDQALEHAGVDLEAADAKARAAAGADLPQG